MFAYINIYIHTHTYLCLLFIETQDKRSSVNKLWKLQVRLKAKPDIQVTMACLEKLVSHSNRHRSWDRSGLHIPSETSLRALYKYKHRKPNSATKKFKKKSTKFLIYTCTYHSLKLLPLMPTLNRCELTGNKNRPLKKTSWNIKLSKINMTN